MPTDYSPCSVASLHATLTSLPSPCSDCQSACSSTTWGWHSQTWSCWCNCSCRHWQLCWLDLACTPRFISAAEYTQDCLCDTCSPVILCAVLPVSNFVCMSWSIHEVIHFPDWLFTGSSFPWPAFIVLVTVRSSYSGITPSAFASADSIALTSV